MSSLWVGTSGYSFKAWKGNFYPAKLPDKQFLPFYAERLATVELNNTFYRTPTTPAIAAWCAAVPQGFRFSVKAPQRITHLSRLKDVGRHLEHLAALTAEFGTKLGVVLFQFPPQFRLDFERLRAFGEIWPRHIPTALEFRNISWDVPEVRHWLRERALCWVYNDADAEAGDGAEEARRAPDGASTLPGLAELNESVGGRRLYVRLRRETYEDAQLQRWANLLRDVEADEVFVFFKHEVSGPGYAARLKEFSSQRR